jgi:hypothetical protein
MIPLANSHDDCETLHWMQELSCLNPGIKSALWADASLTKSKQDTPT